MAAPFTPKQLRFVRRFAEPLFDGFPHMAISIDQVVRNFETQFRLIGGTPVEEMRSVLKKLSIALDFIWDFSAGTIAERRAIIDDHLRHSGIDEAQDAARLRAIIYGAYYGHWEGNDPRRVEGQKENANNPVLKQIGFTLPLERERKNGERELELVPDREISPDHILAPGQVAGAYDVIVIGSGSGGAVAARNIRAQHGYSVLVIEAGPWFPSPEITHEERRMGATLFKNGTLQMTKDNDIVIFQGRNVGGSPTINNGICLKMAQDPLRNTTSWNPFERWKAQFGLDLEAPFMTAYGHIASYLGIALAEKESGKGNGNHLVDGWNKFKAGRTEPWVVGGHAGWFTKNYGPAGTAQACNYCGYCNTGCPYARKLAPAQFHLRDAGVKGARILPNSKVERILWAPRPGGKGPRRAIGVDVLVGEAQVPRQITARVGVVVAAGTIASSKLLERSGIEGTGKGISLNVASPMIALMDPAKVPPGTRFHPAWDEDQMTTAVDCGDFLLESHFQPPQSMAMLMPGWFEEMDRRMRAYGSIRSAGILIPIDRAGELKGEKLKVKFSPADKDLLRRALGTLARVHFANGAKEVWPAIRTGEAMLRPANDADIDAYVEAFFKRTVKEKDDVTLSSAHPHGGNAMHPDPKKGVVDAKCRLHGASNVLVTDASVFPSSIRVNAHFSTMALAQYATGSGDPFA